LRPAAGTPYAGGLFRVKLVLTKEYPAAPPKGFFLTKIFHPNVSDKGDICVNTLKKDWKADTTLSHVLAVVRCLLIVPFPESSLNDDAGKLFMESYDEYAAKARLMTSIHAAKVAPSGALPMPALASAGGAAAAGSGDALAPAAAGAGTILDAPVSSAAASASEGVAASGGMELDGEGAAAAAGEAGGAGMRGSRVANVSVAAAAAVDKKLPPAVAAAAGGAKKKSSMKRL